MNYASRKARRYAEALFSLADERGQAAAIVAEIGRVAATFQALPDLPEVLAHRRIAADRKLALLREVLGGQGEGDEAAAPLSDLAFDFLRLLVARRRVELLPEIRNALQAMLDLRQGLVRAKVTTAVPLLKAERELIERKLASLTGASEVALETQVAKSILGGVVIHVSGQVIDASVRTYLDAMRETLRRVRVTEFDQEGFLPLNLTALADEARRATEPV